MPLNATVSVMSWGGVLCLFYAQFLHITWSFTTYVHQGLLQECAVVSLVNQTSHTRWPFITVTSYVDRSRLYKWLAGGWGLFHKIMQLCVCVCVCVCVYY